MDRAFGVPDWRDLLAKQRITFGDLLDLYKKQLGRIGYAYTYDSTRIQNPHGSTIYHLVFASKHKRGEEFFQKISQRTYDGRRRLFP